MNSSEDTESLMEGLQALATIARRGPLDLLRLARLNGWRQSHAAALLDILEGHGLVKREAGRAHYSVTPAARSLIEPVCPQSLH